MTLIAEKDRPTVRDLLARELIEDVELLLFTRGRSRLFVPGQQECLTCDETRELLEELAGLSDKLFLTTIDLGTDPEAATRFNARAAPTVIVRRRDISTRAAAQGQLPGNQATEAASAGEPAPALATPAELGTNVRFLGLPGGYEFSTLLADVVDVSKARTDLSAEARALVQAIEQPVHIQVFVTPT